MAPFLQTLLILAIPIFTLGQNITAINIIACCNTLSGNLPGKVFFAADTPYQIANANRWSQTAILQPQCIVLPTRVQEVSTAVKILVQGVKGPNSSCPFAIKSGGHASAIGANNMDGGITLDLSWIRDARLSEDRKFATLGAGNTWSNTYFKLRGDTDIALPGGRCGSVGVGGFTLGGGISWFTPRVGFVADNVLRYEVVLASGDIVNATQTQNSDLYMALKGGGSNFGVVTHFDIATFSNGILWGGVVTMPMTAATIDSTLMAISNLSANSYLDPYATAVAVFNYNMTTGARNIGYQLVYTQQVANPGILQAFTSTQHQTNNTMRFTYAFDLANELDNLSPSGYRDLQATVTVKNDRATLSYAQMIMDATAMSLQNITGVQLRLSYDPLPPSVMGLNIRKGGNMLGLSNVQDSLMILMIQFTWQDPALDANLNSAAESWVSAMRRFSATVGSNASLQWLNYAAAFQDPLRSYGHTSLGVMQRVSEKYDPDRVFQDLVPGGFKLRNAGIVA